MLTASSQYKELKQLGGGGGGVGSNNSGNAKTSLVQSRNGGTFYVAKVFDLSAISTGVSDEIEEKKKLASKMTLQAELLKTLEQSNVVKIVGAFLENNFFHIVMEYCDSGTLKSAIDAQNGSHFEEAKIRIWIVQLAMTLKYLHNRNILHRDIRSQNILLTSNGNVLKMGDFGFSKILSESVSNDSSVTTATGPILASLPHMAPEVWSGIPYTFKSDVWAMGVVVYELIALQLPFQAPNAGFQEANIAALFNAICHKPIKPLPTKFSAELRDLVLSELLERDVARRPDMGDVIGHPYILETLFANMTPGSAPPQQKKEPAKVTKEDHSNEVIPEKPAKQPPKEKPKPVGEVERPSEPTVLEKFFQKMKPKQVEDQKPAPEEEDEPGPKKGPGAPVVEDDPFEPSMTESELDEQFNGDYWSSWDANEPAFTTPFETPTSIRAILTVQAVRGTKFQSMPSIILVCIGGEVIGFSPRDRWTSPVWHCKVIAPLDLAKPIAHFYIHHAAYDYVTDDIYITATGEMYIFRINRKELLAASPSRKQSGVELCEFITTSENVSGISVDVKRRLLFACELDYVTIWRIPQQDSSGSATPKATITCVTCPFHVATFFFPSEGDGDDPKVLVAVSKNNEIVLLETNLSELNKRLAGGGNAKDGNKIDDIFSKQEIIANEGGSDELGQVSCPAEVIFDRKGNLFVADCENQRIQIFKDSSEETGENAKPMKSVWASESFNGNTSRIALIPKHPETDQPSAIVSKYPNNVIEWYHDESI